MKRYVVVALLFVACGPPTEEQFAEAYIRSSCEYIVECFADLELYADVDECVSELMGASVTPDPACVYDGEAARDCLSAMEDIECPPEGELPETPSSCDDVYTSCPPDDEWECGL